MLNSTFSYPDSLYIELRNNHSLFLINLADKANISFIIIQESSICNAFSEFFQLLADSGIHNSREPDTHTYSEIHPAIETTDIWYYSLEFFHFFLWLFYFLSDLQNLALAVSFEHMTI